MSSMDEQTMSRADAISHLFGLSHQVEGEFCVGKSEADALEAETTAALRALGVSDEELSA